MDAKTARKLAAAHDSAVSYRWQFRSAGAPDAPADGYWAQDHTGAFGDIS
jgi:hypothetical protein